MKDIKCNENIKSIITSLTELHDDFEKNISTLSNACADIETQWKGYDATLYVAKMREDYSTLFEDFNKCLSSYIEFLNKVHPAYEKHDTTFEGRTIDVG